MADPQSRRIPVHTIFLHPELEDYYSMFPVTVGPELHVYPPNTESLSTGVPLLQWNYPEQVSTPRTIGRGRVIGDLLSYLPNSYDYRDKDLVTWGHEATHGVNAQLRLKANPPGPQTKGCFYVLRGRAVTITEPNTTLSLGLIKYAVPIKLRDRTTWEHYFSPQVMQHWDNRPLYLFDEWVAYANGAEVRLEHKLTARADTVTKTLHFSVYCICLSWVLSVQEQPIDPQLSNFLLWHLNRSLYLYQKSSQELGEHIAADRYLGILRNDPDVEDLRNYIRTITNQEWCSHLLGF